MATNRNIFPQSIEFGDTMFGTETYIGIRFEDEDGSTVTVNFTPQSLERLLDQLAALRGLGDSPGPGQGH